LSLLWLEVKLYGILLLTIIVPRGSEKPSVQEELVFAVIILAFSALVLFGLIIKPSESISDRMRVLLGVLASLAALLAMIVMSLRSSVLKSTCQMFN